MFDFWVSIDTTPLISVLSVGLRLCRRVLWWGRGCGTLTLRVNSLSSLQKVIDIELYIQFDPQIIISQVCTSINIQTPSPAMDT